MPSNNKWHVLDNRTFDRETTELRPLNYFVGAPQGRDVSLMCLPFTVKLNKQTKAIWTQARCYFALSS